MEECLLMLFLFERGVKIQILMAIIAKFCLVSGDNVGIQLTLWDMKMLDDNCLMTTPNSKKRVKKVEHNLKLLPEFFKCEF